MYTSYFTYIHVNHTYTSYFAYIFEHRCCTAQVSAHAENRMSYRSTVDDLRPLYKRLAQKQLLCLI